MADIRTNIDKIIKRRLTAAAVLFKIKHPFEMFDTKAARRKIRRQVRKQLGTSLWKPHQGKKECARRIAQGRAPSQYSKEATYKRYRELRGLS